MSANSLIKLATSHSLSEQTPNFYFNWNHEFQIQLIQKRTNQSYIESVRQFLETQTECQIRAQIDVVHQMKNLGL